MKLLIILFALLVQTQAQALIYETPKLKTCLEQSSKDTANLSKSSVLYVFDIDNTVLALNQNLGSVQWFRWQQKLISEGIKQDRVADTIAELLDKQLQLYQLSKSRPPEPSIPTNLKLLQEQGHPVIYHTSRNTDVRDITERELQANQLIPLLKTVGPDNGFPGQFIFSQGPADQRKISFQKGVYMTAGQDKGVWLLLLLSQVNKFPAHIVFVDDEIKNLQNVERATLGKVPTTLCRYGHMDSTVDAFIRSDKKTEIKLWNEVSLILNKFK